MPWELDHAAREIHIDGRCTRLAEKPFRVLLALLEHPGQVVSRDDLRKRLWPDDTFVDFDNNLNTAVATLRQVLGDSARAPRYIETLPRIGYRLLPAAAIESARPGSPRRYSIGLLAAAAAVVLLVMTTAFAFWPRPMAPATGAMRTSMPQAADAFARGRFLRQQFAVESNIARLLDARAAFRDAVRVDPGFADAIAEEAETVVEMGFAGGMKFSDALREARSLAERALAIADDAAGAHRVMAMTSMFLEWDVDTARDHLVRAEQLDGTVARTAMARATYASALGRHDEAVDAARRAVALEPESYFVRADLALFYLAAGRNEDALASSQAVLDVRPDFPPALAYAATAYERLDRWSEAAAVARSVMTGAGVSAEELEAFDALPPRLAVRRWRQWDLDRITSMASGRSEDYAFELALKNAAAGNLSAALDHLERAYRRRAAFMVFLRVFPELAALHGNPRFERLAEGVAGANTGAG